MNLIGKREALISYCQSMKACNPKARSLLIKDIQSGSLDGLFTVSTDRLHYLRSKLNTLGARFRKKSHFCSLMVHLVKREMQERGYEFEDDPVGKHSVSDHALVRYLERVQKLDVVRLKDKVLDDNLTNYEVVRIGSSVVTIMEKERSK